FLFLLFYILYFFSFLILLPPCSSLFPYTTLFRSGWLFPLLLGHYRHRHHCFALLRYPILYSYSSSTQPSALCVLFCMESSSGIRSEEHTSELQSRFDLVCRLLLEKKNFTGNRR